MKVTCDTSPSFGCSDPLFNFTDTSSASANSQLQDSLPKLVPISRTGNRRYCPFYVASWLTVEDRRPDQDKLAAVHRIGMARTIAPPQKSAE